MAFLNHAGLQRIYNKLTALLNGKVDKVEGKQLSTNDYTTAEKKKLSGIAEGANNYSLPTATATVLGGVKTGSNITNSDGTISLTKANVTGALGYTPPESDTTYGEVTQSKSGLMIPMDKKKLDAFDEASAYMQKSDYDPDGAVVEAGGIPDYVTGEVAKVKKTISSVREKVMTLEDDIEALAGVTVTLPASGWSSSVPYTQSVTVTPMSANWKPGIPSIPKSGTLNVTTSLAELEALRCINAISSSTNTLTFMCFEDKPGTTITIDVPGQLIEG